MIGTPLDMASAYSGASTRDHARGSGCRVDNREVVAARFVEPGALLAEPVLPPFTRAHLGGEAPRGHLSPSRIASKRRRDPRFR